MMNCIQVAPFNPCISFANVNHLRSNSSAVCISPPQLRPQRVSMNFTASSSSYAGLKLCASPQRLTIGGSGFKQSKFVCLFGGKGKSENGVEGSVWKGIEKAVSNFKKEPSVEDLLRQQMQKQEFYDDGGSGGKNTGGGGGRSGGGANGSGSGESDEEGLSGILDETVQVVLATIGFAFLYMFIVEGEQIAAFAKDIIKFLFTRRKSLRLTRLIDSWVRFFQELLPPEDPNLDWLERAIINTPTWFDIPPKYRRLLGDHMPSRSD